MKNAAQSMKIIFTYILILLCFANTGIAQELTLPGYKQYGLKDGLPQAQITTLFQDSRGYIWAGTNNGAARFNGENFFAFTTKNGFPFGYVNNFAEDKQGRIWVLCRHGIACISGDSVAAFPQNEYYFAQGDFTAGDTIRFIATRKKDDKRMVGYWTDGEYKLLDLPFIDRYKDGHLFTYNEKLDAYIFSSEKNIYQVNQNEVKSFSHSCPYKNHKPAKIIRLENDFIVFYVSSDLSHVLCYSFNKTTSELIAEYSFGKCLKYPPDNLREHISFFQGLSAQNFVQYTIENGEIYPLNVSRHNVRTILKDKNGGLWYGAEDGLLRIFSGAFTTFNPALLPEIWSVTEQQEGRFWFASFSYGVKSLKDNKLKSLLLNGKEILGNYFHPAVNGNNSLYFALGDGILKYMPNGKTELLNYTWNDNPPICFYTHYDRERRHLLGGFRGNVAVWDDNDKLVREIGRASGMPLTGFVHCIAQDSAYNFWFGSPDIYHYNWDTNRLKQYASSAEIINCLDAATDHSGRTWFGTQKGLYYYDKQTDSVKIINVPELQNWVLMVLPIDKSRLLLSQPDGLYILDLDEFNRNGKVILSCYNEANGYLGGEPGQAGAFKDSQGHIWITGTSALSRLNPNLLPKKDSLRLNLVFTKYNNTPILYEQHQIKLPHNQESATIVFDAVAFNRPTPVEYNYRINKSKNWSVAQTDNYITLIDLPHGKTTLYVQASLQGVSTIFTIVIYVSKAFYNQAWFIPGVLFLLLLTLIIVTLVYGRTQTRLQKTLMRAKYAEAETIQALMNPHFVYNVLANVQSKIRNLKIEEAEQSLLKMAHLIRRFLHLPAQDIENNDNKSDILKNTVTLAQELDLLQEFIDFQQLLYPQEFIYLFSIDDNVDVEKIYLPPMLLQPFVENSISHGLIPKQGVGRLQIDISAFKKQNKTIIRIIDDGVGIEQSRQMRDQSKFKYPSRGRKLTMRRIHLLNELGFNIEIETETSEKGTTVTIVLLKSAEKKSRN